MTYEYSCKVCNLTFEETRAIKDRYRFAKCPTCKGDCKKIMSVVHFNEIFPGSTKREFLANYWTEKSIEAQSRGFESKGEIETAIGLAKERAKQMGQPDKQLIGPVASPFTGQPYTPSGDEVQIADSLVRDNIKAAHSGDSRKITKAREALKEHESNIKEKANRDFKPKHNKADLQREIKNSREQRKA